MNQQRIPFYSLSDFETAKVLINPVVLSDHPPTHAAKVQELEPGWREGEYLEGVESGLCGVKLYRREIDVLNLPRPDRTIPGFSHVRSASRQATPRPRTRSSTNVFHSLFRILSARPLSLSSNTEYYMNGDESIPGSGRGERTHFRLSMAMVPIIISPKTSLETNTWLSRTAGSSARRG